MVRVMKTMNVRYLVYIVKPGGVKKFAALDETLKVAVYFGNVANVTFISDFVLDTYPLGEITVKNLITLLFVKTKGEWKMVHEHHSPVTVKESTGTPTPNITSDFNPSSASAAQLEVLETFNGHWSNYTGKFWRWSR